MALGTPFVKLIENEIQDETVRSMNALALKWGVPPQYISRWRYDDQLPELWRVPHLSARMQMTPKQLKQIWLDSAEMLSVAKRAEATALSRPTLGGRSNESLPPKSVVAAPKPLHTIRRKARRVGGLILALATGGGVIVAAPRAEAMQSRITDLANYAKYEGFCRLATKRRRRIRGSWRLFPRAA